MNHKTLLSLTVIMLTMMSFGLSASITNRAAADNLVLQLFSDELTDINVYARKTALFDVESFQLYRDLDTLSVPFDGCYMYFIDNCPDKFWSYSARYAFVDITSGSIAVREKSYFPQNFSVWTYQAEYDLVSC
jgi:hypothetical protein